MENTYEIIPRHHNNTVLNPPTATSLRKAVQIAKQYKDCYWQSVTIYRNEVALLSWSRSTDGAGITWRKVNVW